MRSSRFIFTILIALVTALGTFSLVGCGGDEQASESQTASASQSAESSAAQDEGDSEDDEQDNCYGDDLPVQNK